jgi:hypothetical protein
VLHGDDFSVVHFGGEQFTVDGAILHMFERLLFPCLVSIVFLQGSTCRQVSAQANSDNSKKFAASLLEGLLHNNRSLLAFDVAITMEAMEMRPGGLIRIEKTVSRYVQDMSNRQLVAHRKVFDRLNPSEAMDATAVLNAFCFESESKPIAVLNDFGRRKMPRISLARFREIARAPRFVTVGFKGFPHYHPKLPGKDSYWESLTIPSDNLSAVRLNDKAAKVLLVVKSKGKEVRRTEWVFDLRALVPRQRKTFYTHTETLKRHLEQVEFYEWEYKDGVSVPVKIRRQHQQFAVDEETGKAVPYTQFQEAELKWSKLNRDPEEDLLASLAAMNSGGAIKQWIEAIKE